MPGTPLARHAPLPLRRPLPPLVGRCLLASLVAHALLMAFAEGPSGPARVLAKPLKLSLKAVNRQSPAIAAATPPAKSANPTMAGATAPGRQPKRPAPRAVAQSPKLAVMPAAALPTPVAPEAPGVPGSTAAAASTGTIAALVPDSGAPTRNREFDDEAMLAAYTRVLSEAVAPHKRYPDIARLRGWQGTALVEVRVAASGKVLATKISRSSGHEVLDLQAMDMIYRAEPLPAAPRGERQLLVRLPIQFMLVD